MVTPTVELRTGARGVDVVVDGEVISTGHESYESAEDAVFDLLLSRGMTTVLAGIASRSAVRQHVASTLPGHRCPGDSGGSL